MTDPTPSKVAMAATTEILQLLTGVPKVGVGAEIAAIIDRHTRARVMEEALRMLEKEATRLVDRTRRFIHVGPSMRIVLGHVDDALKAARAALKDDGHREK